MTFDEAKDKLSKKLEIKKDEIVISNTINRKNGECLIDNILSCNVERDDYMFIIGTYKENDEKRTESLAIYWLSKDGKKGFPKNIWISIPKDKEVLKVFTQELKNLI